MKILVIEDDQETSSYLARGLQEAGHVVDQAADGLDGLTMAKGEDYDALIVDRMLPSLDGLSIIDVLRKSGTSTPALILSALGNVSDRVRGLRAGGDDYLTKPFAFSELLARLESLTRRGKTMVAQTKLSVANLEMDLLGRKVTRGDRRIELQPREFMLLEYLMKHAEQVVTRTMLLEHVWDFHFDPKTNVVDVHISRIRRKIDRDFDRPLIHTVRGAGYRLGTND